MASNRDGRRGSRPDLFAHLDHLTNNRSTQDDARASVRNDRDRDTYRGDRIPRDRRDDRREYRRDDRRDDRRDYDRRGGGSYDSRRSRYDDDRRDRRNDHWENDRSYRAGGDRRRRSRSPSRRTRSPSRRSRSRDRQQHDAEEQRAEKLKLAKRLEATAKWKAERQAKLDAEKAAAEQSRSKAPSTPVATASAAPSPAAPSPEAEDSAPKPKFDPKKIAKKAKSLIPGAKAALGQDISIPVSTKSEAPLIANKPSLTSSGLKSGKMQHLSNIATTTNNVPGAQAQIASKVGGFGLNANGQATVDGPAKKAMGLDDDQDEARTLEKLPTFSDNNFEDTAQANSPDDTTEMGDDVGMQNELAALAARRAAADNEEMDVNTNGDFPMEGIMAEAQPEAMDEDVDPLDAFMSNLDKTMPETDFMSMKKRPEALYGEDVLGEETEIIEDDELAKFAARKKKKELKPINHGKVEYEPFKKQFYIEPEELKDMDDAELQALRFELDGIKVRGKDVPKPLLSWPQMGLSVPALEVIQSLKYEKPTPIQSQAVPTIMAGRDVIAVAKTGSGKTMGFLLPMFRHIKDQRPLSKKDGPIAIVLAPTRELANQIHGECKPFLKALNLRAAVCFGQASLKDNIDKIKLGVEIVVATPGRLIDLATVNNGQLLSFKRVTYLVLDEADRLWDMGFAPQVNALIHQIRPDRQFVMFSATFPPSMEELARKVLRKPVEIIVGGRATVAPEIEQLIEVRPQSTKFARLLEILGEAYRDETEARTLIFVDRQEAADELFLVLTQRQFAVGSMHGGREQSDRSSTIEDFKSGALPIVVATSVAARGLDVKQLKIVINYDAPTHLEDYIHRAGRTGRAGQTGTCYTFITEEQGRYAPDLCKALKQSGKEVPESLKALQDDYFEKVKSGKAKASSRGFGGHGIEKIDAARDAARGVLGGKYATEDKEGGDKAATKDKEPEIVIHSLADAAKRESRSPTPAQEAAHPQIQVHKREKIDTKGMDPLAAAKLAASRLTGRLTQPNALRSGQSVDNRGPDAGDYHATLQINDQPQKARWAVTNRTNVAKILDSTGVSITSKGIYYAPGKEPAAGELPKLYLLVEGDSEASVMEAMRELYRLLKEGAIMAAEAEMRAPRVGGRYSMI
ncbi:pre-mRNA-processing ATP-dependent RNA helicase PRP5 [Venturia nashicola]|uniref:RNA helicase n=1 Tax=Venturia nashicola TaxID=86259 RepID=A0A4Z1PIJ9_9PEZI|nr:pre-mRNA-processing ATP-dependent RNA helicase PRP5 [Venturia nashicola]TLD34762.1 pre-mRNA-processing ATP-dependent RNA helicase PRP5 [Venturia nashicola]